MHLQSPPVPVVYICAFGPCFHVPPIPGHVHHLYTKNLVLSTFFPTLVILFMEYCGKDYFVFYFTIIVKLRGAHDRGEFVSLKNFWKIPPKQT